MIDQSISTEGYCSIDGERFTEELNQTGGNIQVCTDVKRGNTLYAPSRKTVVVETRFGTVRIAPKSVVLLMVLADGISVYDLHDYGENVSITTADQIIKLSPGKHALITDRCAAAFADLNPAENIAYRSIRKVSVSKDRTAFISEFHLQSAIAVIKPVKRMLVSTNVAEKKTANNLLKTAAIMSTLTSGGEAFQLHVPRSLVASR